MTNEIEPRKEAIERAFNGKKAKSSDNEIFQALGPIFVEWPNIEFTTEKLNLWYLMLRDLDPDTLARAVLDAVAESEFPPTVAAIRKQVPQKSAPGPNSEVDWDNLPPAPPGGFKMFRLSYEEDRQQRMERLRNTAKWDKKYA